MHRSFLGNDMCLKYDENGFMPAIVQDDQGRVLYAYMNEEASTRRCRQVRPGLCRRRQGIWHRGKIFSRSRITVDCDRFTADHC